VTDVCQICTVSVARSMTELYLTTSGALTQIHASMLLYLSAPA